MNIQQYPYKRVDPMTNRFEVSIDNSNWFDPYDGSLAEFSNN